MGGTLALLYAWESPIPPVDPPSARTLDPAATRRGASLALLGDCTTCHTAPGGAPYAGGLAMPTPFGTIYSTNITPDPETGIGRWSEQAFIRALRSGVDREGRHLYPAFPYDHFTRVSDDDAKALYAFFMSIDPVKASAPPNQFPFPLNVRLTLAFWKLLFLRQVRFVIDPSKDEKWNRGKYLVDGLGHCSACHSPRNLLGAEKTSASFEGGEAEGWRAYALGRSSQSPIAWDVAALTDYLARGSHPQHGTAQGPMANVVDNLSLVDRADVSAMASYLASLGKGEGRSDVKIPDPSGPGRLPQVAGVQAATPSIPSDPGGAIYTAVCASCHEGDRPLPLGGLRLALSTAVAGETPANLVNLVVRGIPASAGGSARPIMPGFGDILDDRQISDLTNYLRTEFAGKKPWDGIAKAVAQARGNP
ncbi:Cytochrome c, mono-and diheme variants [Bradyrhizobium lablabi]|uniref:Cytochrome c, mono-and diheme variants n=3 Tax=Nitrobacteraceae TaxID=41294 RepID=A0ABY0P9C7_9BRAD|nr:cytochrome c [Bradyrhizobium lablabi]SDH72196.1 Cytochrome c, mono-and diheme variants [Bradyrhizobium ottawaense]SEE11966.1 Cytochrome c, mono-and diheme variants [Bradyrhizobium lablabi]SHM07917.1 Cytochrome c, mono-and diheme variants [Bradyrhizobium lablabi]